MAAHGPPVGAPALRTIHTYTNKNATLALDVYTYPLRVPAFQGGSKARGWGSLAGSVTFNVTSDNSRVSAITVSVTGTARVLLPKSGSADTPAQIDHLNPEVEEAKEHDVTLLQLEHTLWQADAQDPDSNLFSQGRHPFDFDIDLPAYKVTSKGKKQAAPVLLPPSCVIDAFAAPAIVDTRAKSGGGGGGVMSSIFKSTKDALPKNWASVKYEISVKVHRVGLLKRNLRLSAPFVYLPPPESGHEVALRERRRLANMMAQIVTNTSGDGRHPIESQAPWQRVAINYSTSRNGEPIDLDGDTDRKAGGGGGGLLGSISSLFGTKKPTVIGRESWSLSVPGDAAAASSAFALRSAIPFILRCHTNKPLALRQGSPLIVVLYRRVRLRSGQKAKVVAVQQRPMATAQVRFAQEAPDLHRINGIVVPPVRCLPSFETPLISLSYFLAVQRSRDARIVHEHPITLHCLPPPAPPFAPFGPYPAGYVRPEVPLPQPTPDVVSDLSGFPPAANEQPRFAPPPSQRSAATTATASTSRYDSARSHVSSDRKSGAHGGHTLSPSPPRTQSSSPSPSPSPSMRASPSRPTKPLPPTTQLAATTPAPPSSKGDASKPRKSAREAASSTGRALPPKQVKAGTTAAATVPPAKAAAGSTSQRHMAPAPPPKPGTPNGSGNEHPRRARYSSRGAAPDPGQQPQQPALGAPSSSRRVHVHGDEKRALIDAAVPSRSGSAAAAKVSPSMSGLRSSSVSEHEGEGARRGSAAQREGGRGVGDYVRVSSASKTKRPVEVEPPPPPPPPSSSRHRAYATEALSSSSSSTAAAAGGADRRKTRKGGASRNDHVHPPSASASAAAAGAGRTDSSAPRSTRGSTPGSARRSDPGAVQTLPSAPAPAPAPLPPPPPALEADASGGDGGGAGTGYGFTEDDLMTYGEDMELDLPPSYFEATAEDFEQ
ncbi:uncharacterized protein PSFLO_03193 [Pseudozyma flocculosa]|uniref:Uncharacterized protein n=2 Tax=Pseudozyma flocculosa TaxID=84751 RepID=A0A5C3F1V9_9BASI|nr:uncharacterized protein PSFLO_03193 [Pseudozyma flocculosa]